MANWIYHRGICFSLRRITWLYVMISALPLSTVADSNGIETSGMSWWDARMYCKDEYNSDLFIPEVDTSVENPFNLQHNIHYWVGAVETSQWRWTDNTPLFKHFGFTFSDEHVKTKDLPGNSVTECYNHCKANDVIHYIGLSERTCYCFSLDNLTSILGENLNGNPCPGNSEENCGNNSVISVYKTEVNFSIRDNQHNCAYAGQYLNQLHIFSGDCSRVLYSFCYGNAIQKLNDSRCDDGLCVSSQQASWQSSNLSCSLVKVTSVNKGNLLKLTRLMDNRWVGLHRTVSKIWNNKTRVNGNFSTSTSRGKKCLALWYESKTGLTADWLPCSEKHTALCEQITAPPGTLSTREDLVTTNAVSITFPDASTGVRSSTRNEMNTVKENKYRLYIGVGVGLLLLLSLFIVLMILFRRQGKLCFQKEENKSKGCRTARGNKTYDELQISVSASAVAKSGNLIYRNEAIEIPQTIAEYDQVRNTTETKSDKLVNMSEAKGDFETIKPQRRSEDHSNFYHHLGVGIEDEYDIAGSRTASNVRDSTYTRLNGIKDGGQNTPGRYANLY